MALNADHKDVNESAINHHNKLRALHNSPKLTIDWALAKQAQAYAEKLAKTNSFSHSDSNGEYGENLASSFNSKAGYVFSGEAATQNWYDEIKDYKFNQETQTGRVGHFTQVVWKDSKTAGFGRAKSSSGNFIIVGQYKPAGNFIGEYCKNVLTPTGKLPEKSSPPSGKTTSDNKTPSQKTTQSLQTSHSGAKADKLIKTLTRTSTKNGQTTTEVIETYVKPNGQTYEVAKVKK